uniref:Apolipoprotein M n=1 Tax=Amphiprion percula TaxID=161767 RepID=A0A3P8U3H6_AMPPE
VFLHILGHSAPLVCEHLVKPLDQLDLQHLMGKWAVIAGSLKNSDSAQHFNRTDSVTVDIQNSTYIQASRVDDTCQYRSHNFQGGNLLTLREGNFNFTGTLLNTSCSDCLVMTLDLETHNYKSMDVYFLSKRRQLEPKEVEEFTAQVECLNMPPPIVMDPTKELCPTEATAQPEENPEGQND